FGARPAPPTGGRPAPPSGVDPRAAHEEHREAEHQESEAQIRARLLQEQQDERAKRQLAKKNSQAWEASREQRAAEARSQLTSTWGSIADQPEAKAELATHAERMAQLNRILDVAQDQGDAALVARTNAVIQREIARDTRVLQGIRQKAGVR
ncbi:MAG: hypothetical protein ABW061_13870, partial [Polyangiaceae bacterium]